jgi:hypothetical protein
MYGVQQIGQCNYTIPIGQFVAVTLEFSLFIVFLVVERSRTRPEISQDYPKNVTVALNKTAVFVCPISSDLVASIEWLRIRPGHEHVRHIVMDDVYTISDLNEVRVFSISYYFNNYLYMQHNPKIESALAAYVNETYVPVERSASNPRFIVKEDEYNPTTRRHVTYLEIRNVTARDAGKYMCIAGNSLGPGLPGVAWLIINNSELFMYCYIVTICL